VLFLSSAGTEKNKNNIRKRPVCLPFFVFTEKINNNNITYITVNLIIGFAGNKKEVLTSFLLLFCD
ncbi:hypothetical protein LLI29_003435, partial [Morganella morganii]